MNVKLVAQNVESFCTREANCFIAKEWHTLFAKRQSMGGQQAPVMPF